MKNWRKYKNNSKMEGERKKKRSVRGGEVEKSVRRHAQTFLEKFEVPETLITK